MGHSINRTSFNINKDLTILDGVQGLDQILISNINGVANWKTPTDYISTEPNAHYIGEFFGGGVVVAIWNQNGIERCLVAAHENISTTTSSNGITSFNYGFAWSDINSISSANYKSFGASNSSIIAAQSATSSAKLCIDYFNPDLGTGVWDDWYLPSIYELNYLINNASIFNKVLDSYAYDNNQSLLDIVNITTYNYFPTPVYTTDSIFPSNINLLKFGKTKYTRNSYQYFDDITISNILESNDADYYWSSTESGSSDAWVVLTGTSSSQNLDTTYITKSTLGKVRPFRVADDTQKSFNFDADYAVITYQFSGERDLDTRTTLILPDAPASESGYGSTIYNTLGDGVGWTPDYPTHPSSSTYSVIWHAGDNIGYGYESVLINFKAFKYYYPGQSEIIVDAKAHWYVTNWIPDFVPGDQARLDATPPVILGVDLYKGGTPSKVGYQWVNTSAGASMSLNSYGVRINIEEFAGVGTGMRVAKFKYNVVGKFGYLFSMD
jgi:hypothetical protein